MNSLIFTSIRAFFFSIFSSLHTLIFPQKLIKKKQITWFKLHSSNHIFLQNNSALRTWNVIGLFPSYKLEEIELILFFKSCIIQIFAHQVCMNSLFNTVKLVESYKLYHRNRLTQERLLTYIKAYETLFENVITVTDNLPK